MKIDGNLMFSAMSLLNKPDKLPPMVQIHDFLNTGIKD
jgi:hypothetical protein